MTQYNHEASRLVSEQRISRQTRQRNDRDVGCPGGSRLKPRVGVRRMASIANAGNQSYQQILDFQKDMV